MTDEMAKASGLSLGLLILMRVQELRLLEGGRQLADRGSLFAPCLLEPSYEIVLSLPDDW